MYCINWNRPLRQTKFFKVLQSLFTLNHSFRGDAIGYKHVKELPSKGLKTIRRGYNLHSQEEKKASECRISIKFKTIFNFVLVLKSKNGVRQNIDFQIKYSELEIKIHHTHKKLGDNLIWIKMVFWLKNSIITLTFNPPPMVLYYHVSNSHGIHKF